jgi:hypothetical protein
MPARFRQSARANAALLAKGFHCQPVKCGVKKPEVVSAAAHPLVSAPNMRGRRFGKRAAFPFLHHVLISRKYDKAHLHAMDINIRNLYLNGNLGFSRERVFFGDAVINGTRQDVVRMALTEPAWRKLFE